MIKQQYIRHYEYLEPDVEFVQDGDRSILIRDNRKKYSDQIKDIFKNHCRDFVVIEGDYQARFTKAIKAIDRLIKFN